MYATLDCPACGAPIQQPLSYPEGVIKCLYCGKILHLPKKNKSEFNEPGILYRADFNDPNLTGWEKINPDKVSLKTGSIPEIHANFPSSERVHFILKTSGYLDDQDMRVKIRFLQGDCDLIHAGVCARYEDGIGGYCVLISPNRHYIIGCYETPPGGEMAWRAIVSWRFNSALKAGLNETNELRFVLKGVQLSVYLNGVLATSMKDTFYSKGQSHLAVEPSNRSDISVAFSDLVIFEA